MTTTVATLMTRFTADTTEFTRGASQVEQRLDGTGRSTRRTLDSVNRGMTVFSGAAVAAAGVGIAAFTRFEDSFSNVRKTVSASEEEFAALEASIRNMAVDMDNPLSAMDDAANTLANVMALGGQLGVATEDLEGFTQVVGELSVATNLTAEDAATMIARFANITGMDFENLRDFGNVLVEMGNNFAANEDEIMRMSLRLAAAGERAGLAEPEILAFSTALASVGVSAELGGGNMSRFLNTISATVSAGGEDLENLGRMAGMSGAQFKTAFEEDAAGAISTLLARMGEMEPDEFLDALEELGLGGSESADVIGRLAGNTALLDEALVMANAAWEDSNALQDEATAKADTTQGAMNRLKNQANELAISVGEALAPALNDTLNALGPVLTDVAEWIGQNPIFVQGVMAAAGAFMALKAAVALYGVAAGIAAVAASPLVASVAVLAGSAYVASEVVSTFADAMAPIDTPEQAEAMALSTGRIMSLDPSGNYVPGVPRMYGTGPLDAIPIETAVGNINAMWGNTPGEGSGVGRGAAGMFELMIQEAAAASDAANNFSTSMGNAAMAAQDMQAAVALGAEELPNAAERYDELGARVMALAEANAEAMDNFGTTMLGVLIPSGESTRRLSSDVGALQTQIAGLNAAGVVERVEGPMNQLALVVGAAMGKSAEEVVALQNALNSLSLNLSGVMSDLSALGSNISTTIGLPGFAGGGWTGGGSGVAGVVHGSEYVVPPGGAMVYPTPNGLMMSGSGGGGRSVGNVNIIVQGNVYEFMREFRRVTGINLEDINRDVER